MKIAKGVLINFTVGEYSEFGIYGSGRALVDFNTKDTSRKFRQETVLMKQTASNYISWLEINGFVGEVNSAEYHLGDYGEFNPED